MDTSYCKGTQGSIKPYRNRRAGNCQCCSIPAYVMQARTVTEPYKGLGQGVLVSPSLVLPYLHLKTIFQVYTLSPYFSDAHPPLFPSPSAFKCLSYLNHIFAQLPLLPLLDPLHLSSSLHTTTSPSSLHPSTSPSGNHAHSPLHPSISPTYILSVNHLSFVPSVNHVKDLILLFISPSLLHASHHSPSPSSPRLEPF